MTALEPTGRSWARRALGLTDTRGFLVPVAQALLVGTVFLTAALFAYRGPRPRDAPVLWVGPATAAAGAQTRLAAAAPGQWRLQPVPSTRAAIAALNAGRAVAAVDTASGRLLYAGAAGPTVTGAVTVALPAQLRLSLRPVDVDPLADGDAAGLPLFYLGFAVVLASYLFTVASVVLGRALPARGHVASALLLAVLLGGVGAAVASTTTAAVAGHAAATAALLALLSLATSSGAYVLTALLGALGSTIASIVLLVLASVSGTVVPASFLPAWIAPLRPSLPLGAGLDALRSTIYFGGHAVVGHVVVLLIWALLPALGSLGAGLRRRHHPAGPTARSAELPPVEHESPGGSPVAPGDRLAHERPPG